jgi:Ni,Fe-hydrogenase I cytochrome b subunit
MMDTENSNNTQKEPTGINKPVFQVIYGIVLTLAGIGVFYRIPQVMPKIEQMHQFSSVMGFIRFSFYLLGVLLIGAGLKKIYENYKKL